ncbi:hypothetical protein GIB67_041273 [Kingdonia uniflora]|uniref:DUF7705 domain-containing protein n=1 Tax=Kingdonia uniflora TaxID=39325 RepID=A0A7J7NJE3_9MAGN|nr:hypothetical protein GIB67_041273 [Kingdonia uniflora]
MRYSLGSGSKCEVHHKVNKSDNSLSAGENFPVADFKSYTNPDLYAMEMELYLASLCEVHDSSADLPGNGRYLEKPFDICDPYSNYPEWALHGYPARKGDRIQEQNQQREYGLRSMLVQKYMLAPQACKLIM